MPKFIGYHSKSGKKVKYHRRKSHSMAKKRRGSSRYVRFKQRTRRYGSRGRLGLGSARGLFKDAASGVGGGMVAEQIADRVMPQAAPIAGYAGAYIAGGTKGLIAKVVYDAITGQGGLLSGFGLGQGGGGGEVL